MSARILNILLGSIMVAAIVLNLAAARDFSRPNFEIFPDMVHSPNYQAYEPNPNHDDGKTLRPPAPGAIARGFLPFAYKATESDALRAGEELTNPIAPEDASALARGAAAFAIFCQPCHGPTGAGDGMIAKRGFPPPPSLMLQHAIEMKDGQMFHVITMGQGNMPAHAGQVSRADRWRIIQYIRTLQTKAPNQPTGAQPE